MKILTQIMIVLEVCCGIGILWCIMLCLFISPGVEPEDVLSAVDLDLPNYNIESKSDNLDRGASRWDNYTYEVSFSSKGSDVLINQLQEKGWERENNLYVKSVDIDDDGLTYSAFVNPDSGTATLDVLIDEDYSLIYVFYVIIIVVISALIGGVWGIISLIYSVVTKCGKKNS